jgi:hypothetical protein
MDELVICLARETDGEWWSNVPVPETAGRIHLRSRSRIFTLDATTGTLLWEQPAPGRWRHALPYGPVREVVATDQSVLVAHMADLGPWDSGTGAQQWRVEQPGSHHSRYQSERWSIEVTDPLVSTEGAAILVEHSGAKNSCQVSARLDARHRQRLRAGRWAEPRRSNLCVKLAGQGLI